ncbi:hypothetical protein Desor_3427 [Desulfosporosinus orientis DSM 765]|uniref:Impact N-terminal domain-containing protein n=1 Tax=Desulfosporosinus orientis (strain ATCC 19365 / DSM 765 / NCIMB 8382 / VKM B-1628 / Singapore I) TaxID=768706 RepID=G7WFP9_DESOD|nr:YigZ family protein [Desulfosporosinus orientis]AET68922.1 hypothetical protein Desor_3427 [Desulfosporosinus orientis DSM 765]
MESFSTISKIITEEQVIDKSRFIGIAVPVTSLEQVELAMQKTREDYPNARHYVYAYRLYDGLIEKSSDDGEPQGTGGRPIMDVLQHRTIWNVMIVVVRYFGGILLGTGGLSRAYGSTARLVVNDSDLTTMQMYETYTLQVPYEWYATLKYQLEQHYWKIQKEEFFEVIKLLVLIPESEGELFKHWVDDFTRRQVSYKAEGYVWR